MGQSRRLKDDDFEGLETFIRAECRKIADLKEMQEQSGAQGLFSLSFVIVDLKNPSKIIKLGRQS